MSHTDDKVEVYGISVCADNKGEWDQNKNRRQGLRDLYFVHRYGASFRAPKVKVLTENTDSKLSKIDSVAKFLKHPDYTGLCVLNGDQIVFEDYAADFGPRQIHSIQSITKTTIFLIAGKLVDAGLLDMSKPIKHYIPNIGTGYSHATVQELFDMAVLNDYSEDYADGDAMVGLLEDAHGWRILKNYHHLNLHDFLLTVPGDRTANTDYVHDYKTANTDLAAWICERISGKSLRSLMIEILEAAGIEDPAFLSTDRDGTPFHGGGLHLSLRDLARYGSLLGRTGETVGSANFLNLTRETADKGTLTPIGFRYHNYLFTDGNWIGHLGYGGQWLMAYPETGVVVACLSGLAGDDALDMNFVEDLAHMGQEIADHITKNRK